MSAMSGAGSRPCGAFRLCSIAVAGWGERFDMSGREEAKRPLFPLTIVLLRVPTQLVWKTLEGPPSTGG